MKRAFDIVAAGALIILTLPLWVLIALAIKLQDGGPVLFRQTRVGRECKEFDLLKFRSMVTDAETRGGYQTLEGDPRITPVGRWLRRSSLDELPQLWNVLRGEMSLVGPRPDTPAQASGYPPDAWALRCSLRPGMTGLAQVRRKSTSRTKSRLDLDLEYVRNRNLWLDLSILGRTVLVALLLANR